jgi:multicomponent Na+:H+ antiporter subunit F
MSAILIALGAGLGLLALAAILAVVRLAAADSLANRVLVLDFLAIAAVAASAVYAMLSGRSAFLDVGLVIAVAAFVATVAFGVHIERSGSHEEDQP